MALSIVRVRLYSPHYYPSSASIKKSARLEKPPCRAASAIHNGFHMAKEGGGVAVGSVSSVCIPLRVQCRAGDVPLLPAARTRSRVTSAVNRLDVSASSEQSATCFQLAVPRCEDERRVSVRIALLQRRAMPRQQSHGGCAASDGRKVQGGAPVLHEVEHWGPVRRRSGTTA